MSQGRLKLKNKFVVSINYEKAKLELCRGKGEKQNIFY